MAKSKTQPREDATEKTLIVVGSNEDPPAMYFEMPELNKGTIEPCHRINLTWHEAFLMECGIKHLLMRLASSGR